VKPDDPVEALIDAYHRVNLVALGERHWSRDDAHFRQQLVQHPGFARQVNDIVIEFANPLHQAVLQCFVEGGLVPHSELCKIWQDTTQPGAWDSTVYEDFLQAVRNVNAGLPVSVRLRLWAADYPIDWQAIRAPEDLPNLADRDRTAATIIQREILARDRKALVLFGSAHIYRNRPGTIVELLTSDDRATWFVVTPIGGRGLPKSILAVQASSDEAALIALANHSAGDLHASDVLERGTRRIKVVDGNPVFIDGKPVFIPVFEPGLKVRQLTDALLYFGETPIESIPPHAGLYDGTEYGREIQRRKAIVMTPRSTSR
jgi:hypothetical protein